MNFDVPDPDACELKSAANTTIVRSTEAESLIKTNETEIKTVITNLQQMAVTIDNLDSLRTRISQDDRKSIVEVNNIESKINQARYHMCVGMVRCFSIVKEVYSYLKDLEIIELKDLTDEDKARISTYTSRISALISEFSGIELSIGSRDIISLMPTLMSKVGNRVIIDTEERIAIIEAQIKSFLDTNLPLLEKFHSTTGRISELNEFRTLVTNRKDRIRTKINISGEEKEVLRRELSEARRNVVLNRTLNESSENRLFGFKIRSYSHTTYRGENEYREQERKVDALIHSCDSVLSNLETDLEKLVDEEKKLISEIRTLESIVSDLQPSYMEIMGKLNSLRRERTTLQEILDRALLEIKMDSSSYDKLVKSILVAKNNLEQIRVGLGSGISIFNSELETLKSRQSLIVRSWKIVLDRIITPQYKNLLKAYTELRDYQTLETQRVGLLQDR